MKRHLKTVNKKLQTSCQLPYRKLSLAIALAFSMATHADTFTVTNTNNNGIGSLRLAVLDTNINAGPDTIEFSTPSGSIFNLDSELKISDTVTIKECRPLSKTKSWMLVTIVEKTKS